MKSLLILLTLLAFVATSQCGCAFWELSKLDLRLTDQVKACSTYIACLLEKLCKGDLKVVKRDTSFMGRLQKVVISKEIATEAHIRKKRYLIDECCENSCTIQTLTEFCQVMSKDLGHPIFDNT